jgi:hypothetical protein
MQCEVSDTLLGERQSPGHLALDLTDAKHPLGQAFAGRSCAQQNVLLDLAASSIFTTSTVHLSLPP